MPETLRLPTTLNGRYAIERELGSGGFLTLYVARDLKGGGRVVLKVLRPEAAATVAAEQFLHGAQVISRLQHPNILAVVDSGTDRGPGGGDVVYSVQPFLDGGSLRQRLEREPQLPLDEALRIAGGIAGALDFAHREGVVHEDLKPESVLFRAGEPVVDFGSGLPTALRSDEWQSDPELAARTASHISPEQIAGQPADPRSDQYALAALIYEMLTGQAPFTGPSAQVIATRVLTEPPPRLTALRVIPRIVERGIHRALAKNPAERFRTVGELLAALHGASSTPGLAASPTAPASSQRRQRAPLIVSLVVLAMAAGIALASRAVVNRRTTASAAHSQLTFSGAATSPALSPDGRSVAYLAGGRSLLVQRLDGGDPVALIPSARRITAARWTGDGRALVVAMTRDSTERPATFLVPATGGSARKVLDDARPFDTGPDSTVIVRAPRDAGRLEIVSLASGKVRGTIAIPDSIGAVSEVAWSPNRRWIAFTEASDDELWVVGAGGGSPSHVADAARTIRWARGSDALYFLSGPAGTVDLMRVGIDEQSGRAATNATRVTALLASAGFDVGRDDQLVHAQTSRDAPLRTFVFGTGARRQVVEEHPLNEGTAPLHGAAISPDGRWVAYVAALGAERDIHVVAFGGGSARVVAASAAREEAPAWSPDGTRLTYAQQDSTGRRVMLADARTGAPRRIGSLPGPGASTAEAPGASTAARWSASGRHIAYYADDLRRIALVNLQRRNESVVRLPDNVGTGLVVVPSPNGTQLIASTRPRPDEAAALWLVFGNGRRWRPIPGPFGEAFPVAWHRNSWIYLVRNRGLATDHGAVQLELWRMRGPTGRPELYAALPEGCGLSVSISADGSRGVCNYVRVESDLYVASNFGVSGR